MTYKNKFYCLNQLRMFSKGRDKLHKSTSTDPRLKNAAHRIIIYSFTRPHFMPLKTVFIGFVWFIWPSYDSESIDVWCQEICHMKQPFHTTHLLTLLSWRRCWRDARCWPCQFAPWAGSLEDTSPTTCTAGWTLRAGVSPRHPTTRRPTRGRGLAWKRGR